MTNMVCLDDALRGVEWHEGPQSLSFLELDPTGNRLCMLQSDSGFPSYGRIVRAREERPLDRNGSDRAWILHSRRVHGVGGFKAVAVAML